MRQATQFGLDFAISPDETPHQKQCHHVLVGFRDESTPRRCLGLKIPNESYCRAHYNDDPLWARRRAEWSKSFDS